MLTTINALLPVILVIAIGHTVSRTGIITGDQWRGIEQLAYYVLFPAVLIEIIGRVDFTQFPTLTMGGALLASVFTMGAILLVLRPVFEAVWSINSTRFTSIFQGTMRWNAFIALPLADSLFGDEGLALLAVAMVVMVPVLNTLSILFLARYAGGTRPSAKKIVQDVAKNPFIISISCAILINLSGFPLPEFAWTTLEIVGSAALPVGIVCVGASLDLSALRRPGPALSSGTLLRLLGMPLIAAGFAWVFGVTGTAQAAMIIAASVPSAGSSYILAKQMGGDAKLMAEILTLQSILAIGTIPVVLYVLT